MPKGDRNILKADTDDGYTKIANLLLEALAIARLTGKEKGAVLYLWRRTYGWQKNSARLKEAAISLQEWAKILNTDRSHASSILAGLVEKRVFIRHFFGPGKGYIYTTNTAVTEWGNGCIKRQQLLEITTQPLPESATVGLPKTATPSDTNLVSRKERLKKIKEITKDINIDTKYKSSKYGHMVCQTSEDIAWVKAIRKERKKALGFDKKERTTDD